MDKNSGALEGILVVELGQLIAGPFCGQLLGDMGADVIKVEPPGAGDPMRQWGNGEHKVWWEVIARNKRSVTANLRLPEGRELVRKLVVGADILIENFRPGTMEKWGLGPDQLHAINPGLIMVRISGYGQTGPYAERAGFGGIAEAMGGWRAIVGDPDRSPSRMGVSIGDTLAGNYGCMGALAALREREKSGKGQVVDVALYESVLQVMESLIVEYDAMGIVRQRSGAILPGIAPSNVYPCADGEYMIGANGDAIFARLARAMGRPELALDERYATHISRGKHQAELDAIIADWTRMLRVDDLERLMTEHSIPSGRLYTAPDMLVDPHFAAREAIVEVPHPYFGSLKMQAPVPKLSRSVSGVRRPAPRVPGADNQPVYRDLLGITESELRRLKEANAI